MEKSFIFNSVNGDRRYKADDFREYFASFIGNGVFPNPSTGLQTLSNTDMTVTIRTGKGWINGAIYHNTEDLILKLDNADGVLSRIDRVVLRMDRLDRNITCIIKKGDYSSNPIAKTLQRDADAHELCIAEIKIDRGITTIAQSKITDTRLDTNLCGIVTQTINEIDTTTLYKQLEAHIEEKGLDMTTWISKSKEYFSKWLFDTQTEYSNDFDTWFDTIKNALDGDIAGNLLNKIIALEEIVKNLKLESGSVMRPNGKNVEESIYANETSIQDLEKNTDSTNTNLSTLKTKVDAGQNFNLTQDSGAYNTSTGINIDNLTAGWHNIFQATGTLPDGFTADNNVIVEIKGTDVNWLREILYDVRSSKSFDRNKLSGVWQPWRSL